MEQFTKREIAKLLGKPPRTISYWTDFGLVIPDITPSQGRGKARIYSEKNLLEFGMIEIMSRELNVSLDDIQKIMNVLRDGKPPTFGGSLVISAFGPVPSQPQFTFGDFFLDRSWGIKSDILYKRYNCMYIEKHKPHTISYSYFFLVNENFSIDLAFDFKDYKGKVVPEVKSELLWLGKIRNMAMMKYGIDLPEKPDPF
jgi:DNA-binding transcriptional MerR regulator